MTRKETYQGLKIHLASFIDLETEKFHVAESAYQISESLKLVFVFAEFHLQVKAGNGRLPCPTLHTSLIDGRNVCDAHTLEIVAETACEGNVAPLALQMPDSLRERGAVRVERPWEPDNVPFLDGNLSGRGEHCCEVGGVEGASRLLVWAQMQSDNTWPHVFVGGGHHPDDVG